MTSIVLILVAIAAWGWLHSWLASLRVKAAARRLAGPVSARGYRLAYNLLAAITFLPVLALPFLLPDRPLYSIPVPWVALTTALQLSAVLMLAVGLLQTGALSFAGIRQLFAPGEPEDGPLVTGGLYRYARHPLYTAGLVFIWATPVMTLNRLALYAGLSAYLIIGALFEERKLLRVYGQAYADYRARTPMFIPGLKTRRSA